MNAWEGQPTVWMSPVTPGNRRNSPRLNEQVPVEYECDGPQRARQTLTINVSESGARLVVHGSVPRRFTLTFATLDGPVRMRAERVWEQPLGGTGRILGVRFTE